MQSASDLIGVSTEHATITTGLLIWMVEELPKFAGTGHGPQTIKMRRNHTSVRVKLVVLTPVNRSPMELLLFYLLHQVYILAS